MLQLDVRPMAVRSVVIERISTPAALALSKGPRSIGDPFWDNMPEEWLQDGYASADETRVDLDDAPEESLGGYPRTICRCEVSHRVDETYDGDGPVPKCTVSWGRSGCKRMDRTHTEPTMKMTDTPILSLRDSCSRHTMGSGRMNINRSVIKFSEP